MCSQIQLIFTEKKTKLQQRNIYKTNEEQNERRRLLKILKWMWSFLSFVFFLSFQIDFITTVLLKLNGMLQSVYVCIYMVYFEFM